jgi:hypothetical protein
VCGFSAPCLRAFRPRVGAHVISFEVAFRGGFLEGAISLQDGQQNISIVYRAELLSRYGSDAPRPPRSRGREPGLDTMRWRAVARVGPKIPDGRTRPVGPQIHSFACASDLPPLFTRPCYCARLVVGFRLVHSALAQEPTSISTIVARVTGTIIRAF